MAYGKSRLTRPEVIQVPLMPVKEAEHELMLQTSRDLQRIANECVVEFLLFHRLRKTRATLEAKQPAAACPPDLCRAFRERAVAMYPQV